MDPERLNSVLARALKDQNSAVALKAIHSLQGVAGQSNMFGGRGGDVPLVDAMRFPDRTVRYEAAMLSYLRAEHKGILKTIRDSKQLEDDTAKKLKDALTKFGKQFA